MVSELILMRPLVLCFIGLTLLLFSCKSDKKQDDMTTSDGFISSTASEEENTQSQTRVLSKMLYARLDRLKIRVDSTMGAKTATVISEGDTLIFQDDFSTHRENLKLRGKNYYEPWLKVMHPKSGKSGWVYGGAVIYDSKELKKQHDLASPLFAQVYADDLEWEGTVPTGWAKASITNPEDFKLFLIRFKGMVANDDIDQLANLVNYPLKDIKNKADFRTNYSRLFTQKLKDEIDQQRLDRIYRNNKGAMIGDNSLWFQQVGSTYKIVSLDFKGVEDIARELMRDLSGIYLTDGQGKKSIKAFNIKRFLELTLNYQTASGYPDSKTLGRYKHETTYGGKHSFVQDTQDSIVRKLVFQKEDSIYTMQILNDTLLQDVTFFLR